MFEAKDLPANYMKKYLGYKFFKELEDGSFDIIRIIKTFANNSIKILKEDGTTETVELEYMKDYTPLEPFGVISFNVVSIYLDEKHEDMMEDVMVMAYKLLNLKLGDQAPYLICRQSVNDFFGDLLKQNPLKNSMVGICCSQENCPTNVNFQALSACDEVEICDLVHIYKDDNLDTILQCEPNIKYMNNILYNSFCEHCKSVKIIPMVNMESHDGWCTSVKQLLKENNFMQDLDSMMDITGVDFKLTDYLEKREDSGVYELNNIALLFFKEITKVNATQTRVIKFNYSIDMSKFANDNYVFWRDNTNTVYLIVYLVEGEFLEEELRKEIDKADVTEKLRLMYYNKYAKMKD